MNQSSTSSLAANLRTKGIRNNSGILIKGVVKDATSKLSVGTIPSNYQTIIYRHESNTAFGTNQKRFYQQSQVDLEKMDLLEESINKQSFLKTNVSHSKMGYGPFISKQQRNWIPKSYSPGPGKYERDSKDEVILKKQRRKCFTRQKIENKAPPLTENKVLRNDNPGPGQYYIRQISNCNNGWKSTFKSKLVRNAYPQTAKTPGPGYYNVKLLNQQNKKQDKQNIPVISHKNTEDRIFKIFERDSQDSVPGPGAYEYDIPNFKPLYQRIKINGNFVLSRKDRFNNIIDPATNTIQKQQQAPDVYSYNLKSGFDNHKRLLQWPCFMSQSKRAVFTGEQGLGPSLASLEQVRKNFHFNIKTGWV